MTKRLGWRLENLRDNFDYSQKEISLMLNFSSNTYGQYESEERTPSLETLIKLADVYQVSLDHLIRGKEYQTKENDQILAIKEVLQVFNNHNIQHPYLLKVDEWNKLSRDDLIVLSKHFEWIVSQKEQHE